MKLRILFCLIALSAFAAGPVEIKDAHLTGTPTAPTATVGTNTTQVASTAFVLANSSSAPTNATYITQTPNSSLSAEQALSLLATGVLKNTTSTGVLSIADAASLRTYSELAFPGITNASYELRNTHKKFLTIASGSPARVNVLGYGDSVGHRKVDELQATFYEAYGNAGIGLQSAGLNVTLAGDCSSVSNDFSVWVTGNYYDLGGTGSVKFSSNTTAAITLKIFYIAQSGAGSFKVQSSPAGTNTWTDEATINASNGSTIGAISTITKSAGAYDVRALGTSGRVKIIGAATLNASGVAIWNITADGITLANTVATPTAIFNPIITDIAPDLIVFEMKDTTSIFNTNLAGHQSRFDAVAPLSDWIYSASNPVGAGQDDGEQVSQNAVLRTFAQTNHKGFFDGYGIFVDYATFVAQGYSSGDGVHPNSAGSNFAARIMARQFGFFNADAVAIHKGTIVRTNIDGSPIGQTTQASIKGTDLTLIPTAGGTSLIITNSIGTGKFDLTNITDSGTYLDFDTQLVIRTGYAGSGGTVGTFTSGGLSLNTPLPKASGGTGTATPSIVAGSNVTVTGTWPNQTISAANSGGDALVANSLSQFAATTSAQLRGVLSDELGTGAALFDGATPTSFVGTNISGTAASLTAGNATKWTTGRTIALTGDVTYTSGSLDGSGNVTGTATLANIPAISGANLTALTAANITASTTAGRNLLNVTNPSAISFPKIAADNTVSTRTPAQVLSDIGAQASGSYAASGANADITSATALNTLTAASTTNLVLNGGSSGGQVTLGQGTNANITLTPSGTGTVNIVAGTASANIFAINLTGTVSNQLGLTGTVTNSSAAGVASWRAINSSGKILDISCRGSSMNAYGVIPAGQATTIYSNAAGALALMADDAAGFIAFGAGSSGPERMRIKAGVTVGDTTDPGATNFRVAGTSALVGNVTASGTLAVTSTSTFTGASTHTAGAIMGAAMRLKAYTVSTLPAGTQGDTAFVTDALAPTFLATVVGGGAVVAPVFYNGTNWVGY